MLKFLVNNKKITFSLLFLIIFLSAMAIVAVNKFNNLQSSGTNSNLKGYANLKQKFDSLELNNNQNYQQIVAQFNSLESKNLNESAKYFALMQISNDLSRIYSNTTNNNIYNFITKDLGSFAKNNFQKLYSEKDFITSCMDTKCSNSVSSKEIAEIIKEINSLTTISSGNKEGTIHNLKVVMYNPTDTMKIKYKLFLEIASQIRTDDEFTKAGVNIKIADEIEDFLKIKYPNEYAKTKGL